jgi:hypothetical protein
MVQRGAAAVAEASNCEGGVEGLPPHRRAGLLLMLAARTHARTHALHQVKPTRAAASCDGRLASYRSARLAPTSSRKYPIADACLDRLPPPRFSTSVGCEAISPGDSSGPCHPGIPCQSQNVPSLVVSPQVSTDDLTLPHYVLEQSLGMLVAAVECPVARATREATSWNSAGVGHKTHTLAEVGETQLVTNRVVSFKLAYGSSRSEIASAMSTGFLHVQSDSFCGATTEQNTLLFSKPPKFHAEAM